MITGRETKIDLFGILNDFFCFLFLFFFFFFFLNFRAKWYNVHNARNGACGWIYPEFLVYETVISQNSEITCNIGFIQEKISSPKWIIQRKRKSLCQERTNIALPVQHSRRLASHHFCSLFCKRLST